VLRFSFGDKKVVGVNRAPLRTEKKKLCTATVVILHRPLKRPFCVHYYYYGMEELARVNRKYFICAPEFIRDISLVRFPLSFVPIKGHIKHS
jgi:hypothetical protein